jgi:AcrR family transcriptional regulator
VRDEEDAMTERDVKERILDATNAILRETDDPSQITVRQIAERAGVSIGSINYNFGSKDALIADAVWQMIGISAASWYTPDTNAAVDPVTRLRRMFKEGMRLALAYPKYMHIGLMHVLETGNMEAKSLILPLVREIVGAEKHDVELRMLAFQLVATVELAFLNLAQLCQFLGVDPSSEATIDAIIDIAVDNLVRDYSKE